MIFVLGILVLLALMGLLLLARTHGESKRVALESTGSSEKAAMDGMVDLVRQTLRKDIWGKPPAANQIDIPLAADGSDAAGITENNEPYDAPGPSDRWLASTTPYHLGDRQINDPPETETKVLAWHRVSYVGGDVLRTTDTLKPFRWRTDARTGQSLALIPYSDSNLANVQILQTPPPGMSADLIPGSTTNRTIAVARQAWLADPPTAADGLDANVVPQFPYFDTNADGVLDLYDADGDGVPDSPISLVVPIESPDPNGPEELYAAIRVVDHASMLNVNVASSLRQPVFGAPSGPLTFDESTADRQRRGRRLTELLLDETMQVQDSFVVSNRTARLMDFRWNDATPPDPKVYDQDVVRRMLVGGRLNDTYKLYTLKDEASLRHRNMLVPLDRVDDRSPPGNLYANIDRALSGTLLWSRAWDSTDPTKPRYDLSVPPRWNRLNSNYVDATWYEGYDDAGGKGWRSLLRDDEPCAVRRSLLTTVSHEVVPPPAGVVLDPTENFVVGLSEHPVRIVSGSSPNTDVYMDWPVLHKDDFPTEAGFPNVPAHLRILPIDLNMSNADPSVSAETTKRRFMQYVAAAMYLALDPRAGNYQGFALTDNSLTTPDERLNREYLAWQFAANIADYRDSDGEPTILQWVYQNAGTPTEKSTYIYGVEKQPFLTEAYARLVAGDTPPTGPAGESFPDAEPDKWFCAIELYVPPLWKIPTTHLYLRLPGVDSTGLISLSSFRLVSSPTTLLSTLDGGPANGAGRYYVLCGSPNTAVPAELNTAPFYRDNRLDIHVEDAPGSSVELVYSPNGVWADPRTHVLDVISAEASGPPLAGASDSGVGSFAFRDPAWSAGTTRAWSLQRSTKGWRFTTAWHHYSPIGPLGESTPAPINQSLGAASDPGTRNTVDANIPESVWPTLVSTGTTDHEPLFPDGAGNLVAGFTSGRPFEAFDSVAEISRLFMVGPIRLSDTWGSTWGPPSWNLKKDPITDQWLRPRELIPVTLLLAHTVDAHGTAGVATTGDFPPTLNAVLDRRCMAGRVDFGYAKLAGGIPWTWRLLNYFTTQSPLNDGVDNDGNGAADLSGLDATEGVNTLNRVAGRININTAPASVLRSIPLMSLLPTSAEYTHYAGGPVANPVQEFTDHADAGWFWDFPSAIIAQREGRRVPLRLPNNAGAMVTVAEAWQSETGTSPSPYPQPFPNLAGLIAAPSAPSIVDGPGNMADIYDVLYGRNDLFTTNRFWAPHHRLPVAPVTQVLPLMEHTLAPGGDWGSPDFRSRDDGAGTRLIDYVPLGTRPPDLPAANTGYDNGGLRARDVFLARWSSLLTTRSDVFTAYIVLLDEDGNYVQRCQVTLDRSVCFGEKPTNTRDPAYEVRRPILPRILFRQDGSYLDDTK